MALNDLNTNRGLVSLHVMIRDTSYFVGDSYGGIQLVSGRGSLKMVILCITAVNMKTQIFLSKCTRLAQNRKKVCFPILMKVVTTVVRSWILRILRLFTHALATWYVPRDVLSKARL
ncbi:hypothetical protein C0989_007285 [Termitomyces sp. Mn162]|nr:hypothetical protein C0989_007285 [Termitomyces sp. Mn162]